MSPEPEPAAEPEPEPEPEPAAEPEPAVNLVRRKKKAHQKGGLKGVLRKTPPKRGVESDKEGFN